MEFDQRPDIDLVSVGQEAGRGDTSFVGDASQGVSGITPLLQGQEIDVNELAIQAEIERINLTDMQRRLINAVTGRSAESAVLRKILAKRIYGDDVDYLEVRDAMGHLIRDTKELFLTSSLVLDGIKIGNQTAYFLRLSNAAEEKESISERNNSPSGGEVAKSEIWVGEDVYVRRLEEYKKLEFKGRDLAERMLAELIKRDKEHAFWVSLPSKRVRDRLEMTLSQISLTLLEHSSRLKVAGVNNVGPNGETGYYSYLEDENLVPEVLKTFQQNLFEALMRVRDESEDDEPEDDEPVASTATHENVRARTIRDNVREKRRGILLSEDRMLEFQRGIGYTVIEAACSCLTLPDDKAKAIEASVPYLTFTRMKKGVDRIIKLSLGENNLLYYGRELLDPQNPRAAETLFWKSFSETVDKLWAWDQEERVSRNINAKLSRGLDVVKRLKDDGWSSLQIKSVVARHFGVEELLAEELQQQTEEN